MSDTMNAWTYGHEGYPAALRQTTLPKPKSPSSTEIHVRVRAAAINPVDIQLMNLPVWPYLPTYFARADKGIAHDFSGIVEEAGSASGFKKGDEVGRRPARPLRMTNGMYRSLASSLQSQKALCRKWQ